MTLDTCHCKSHARDERSASALGPWARVCRAGLKLPIHVYRATLKPLIGVQCRHLPTCSEYALDAVDHHGAWRGLWLILARLARCHPWGTSGFDPVPRPTGQSQRLMPWRYGVWWRVTPPEDDARRATEDIVSAPHGGRATELNHEGARDDVQ